MLRYLFLLLLLSIVPSAYAQLPDAWPDEVNAIEYTSSADGTQQPAAWYVPPGDGPFPLLVAMHPWGGGYTHERGIDYAVLAIQKGWAFIFPHFRGANNKPEALGSELVVGDILSAVTFAEENANIDSNRVYLVGASGGGHAALLMAGRAPWRWSAVSAWVPITDLAAWYAETLARGLNYPREIAAATGGAPGASPEVDFQYAQRSPITHIANALTLPIEITTGIKDGHQGSVPITHTLNVFNILADSEDRLTGDEIEYMVTQAALPPHLQMTVADTTYRPYTPIFRRQSGEVRLTLFNGGHSVVPSAAVEWLAGQSRPTVNYLHEGGWHLLASPVVNATLKDVLGSLWTQGFPGSDSASAATANVYLYDETRDTTNSRTARWVVPAGQDAAMTPGRGYAVYLFDDQNGDGNAEPLPRVLTAPGAVNPAPFSFDGSMGYALSHENDGWNLIGNPFDTAIDWDTGVSRAGLDGSVYVWDPATADFLTWNGVAGGLTDGLIPPFRGFFVKANAPDPSLVISAASQTSATLPPQPSPALGGEGDESPPLLKLELEHDGRRTAAYVMLSEQAALGPDELDSYRLRPLTPDYTVAFTRRDDGAALAVNALPLDVGTQITIPLDVRTTASGSLTLRATRLEQMESYSLTLVDHEQDARIVLAEGTEYAFTAEPSEIDSLLPDTSDGYVALVSPTEPWAQVEPRFTLELRDLTSTAAEQGEVPGGLELLQSAPNPFRDRVTFRFGLPHAGPVRLAVYDLLGREVARVIDGARPEGWHTVRWDAGPLPAGVYVYRLQFAGVTRHGTMIRVL